jgi:hypothetical protein
MLTRSFHIDASGHWERRMVEFAEDVVVACAGCGVPPRGCVESRGDRFSFVPVEHPGVEATRTEEAGSNQAKQEGRYKQ